MDHTQTIEASGHAGPTITPVLRPATPADARVAAKMIYAPMGRLGDYLFGEDDAARAIDVLARLFAQKENRFTCQFSDVLETAEQLIGLLLGYPGHVVSGFSAPMAKQLREILGWAAMLRLIRRSLPLMNLKECEPDEFYIFTISILPEFQGNGLGTRLLMQAEGRCRAAGLNKCSLGVTTDNERAIHFYEEFGYKIVDTVRVPHLERVIGYPGYHRMVKHVTPQLR